MKQDCAFITILNGVLLDVMPAITVSFALAALSQLKEDRRDGRKLREFIEFGYGRSGYSFLEKLCMLFEERCYGTYDPRYASQLYATIKDALTHGARVIPGALYLLDELSKRGIPTFVTSVMPQQELEESLKKVDQGSLESHLSGVLGDNGPYKKLEGHLELIRERLPHIKRFYLLFDAPSEIRMAIDARIRFDVRVVGLVHEVKREVIIEFLERGVKYLDDAVHVGESLSELSLPCTSKARNTLSELGADRVVLYQGRASLQEIVEDVDQHLGQKQGS